MKTTGDNLFHKIEDVKAVTRTNGIYRQVNLYCRAGMLYVNHSNGFAFITRNGTSVPNLRVDSIDGLKEKFDFDEYGRMILPNWEK